MDSTQSFSQLKERFREIIRHWDDEPNMTEWVAERSLLKKWPLPNDIDLMTNKVEIEHTLNLIEQRIPAVMGEAQPNETHAGETIEDLADRQDKERPEVEAARQAAKERKDQESQEETIVRTEQANSKDISTILHCASLIPEDRPREERFYRLKQMAIALDVVWTADLLNYALGEGIAKFDAPCNSDSPFVVPSERWLWEGFIKLGEFNLMAAEEKIGKTALGIHIGAASLRGDSHCLGVAVPTQIDGIVIWGPDCNRAEYGKILRREGLLVGDKLDPRVRIWHKGMKMPVLNESGILEVCKTCSEFERPLLLIDTLFKVTAPVLNAKNVGEGHSEWMIPHQQLDQALTGLPNCVVTELCLTHTKKGRNTSITGASKGTNQATGDASHILCMSYVTPDGEQTRSDFRRQLFSDGRDKGKALICEIRDNDADGEWVSLGNAEGIAEQSQKEQALEALSGKRQVLWHWMQWKAVENIEGGTFTIQQGMRASGMTYSSTWQSFKCFIGQGFLEQVGVIPAGSQGGREEKIYKVAPQWADAEMALNYENADSTNTADIAEADALIPKTANKTDNTDLTAKSFISIESPISCIRDWGANPPYIPTKVEINIGGKWSGNGWALTGKIEDHDPSALVVEAVGNPNLTRSRNEAGQPLRWGLDVRECKPGTHTEPEPGEPGYDPNAPF